MGDAERTIAVVAIHGVADQKPGESARAIASLLVSLGPEKYSAFTERPLIIERRPVEVSPDGDASDLSDRFMRTQLEQYHGDGAHSVYETVRLEGTRTDAGGNTKVHVHEMYWADLSRVGGGPLAFLGALYQLLLHLPSLGRKAIDYAAIGAGKKALKFAARLHRGAIWILTLPIALMNLALLTLVAAVAAVSLPSPQYAVIGGCVLLGALTFVAGTVLKIHPWQAVIAGLAVGAIAAAIAKQFVPIVSLAFLAWVLTALVVTAIARSYSRLRPHALGAAVVIVIVVGSLFAAFLAKQPSDQVGVNAAAMLSLQSMLALFQLAWLCFIVFMLTAIIAAVVGIVGIEEKRERQRVRRAAWTARVTLAFSALLFANLTLVLWYAIVEGVKRYIPDGTYPAEQLRQLCNTMTFGFLSECCNAIVGTKWNDLSLAAFAEKVVLTSAQEAFLPFSLAFVLVVLTVILVVAPAVMTEVSPSQDPSDKARSRHLGRWLTKGFNGIAFMAWALPLAFLIALILGVIQRFRDIQWLAGLEQRGTILAIFLGANATALVGLLTLKGPLTTASATLDVMLDVDNYMREHPRDNNPRARIAERFVSLLRHLHRPVGTTRYSRIIYVMHSQGSVIAADTLRFVKENGDRHLTDLGKSIPINLFTMGSPLRQLYARLFPHMYKWIDDGDGSPDPKRLAVKQWINAYRSGDYIGRCIWASPEVEESWDAVETYTRESRREFCLGEGAHVHYWDKQAGAIANTLDAMIASKPLTTSRGLLDDFDPIEVGGRTVYRSRNSGPGVLLMHELPGLSKPCIELGQRLVDAGYRVYMPLLFGKPEESASIRNAFRICISREFYLLRKNQTSPITKYLRELSAFAHGECKRNGYDKGIGVIGMCLTGNFVITLMIDPHVLAPVISQPSSPLGFTPSLRCALGVDPEDLEQAKKRDLEVLAFRFSHDVISPGPRMERLKKEFGNNLKFTYDSGPDNEHGLSRFAHAVLTEEFVDKQGHPTRQAFDTLLDFLKRKL